MSNSEDKNWSLLGTKRFIKGVERMIIGDVSEDLLGRLRKECLSLLGMSLKVDHCKTGMSEFLKLLAAFNSWRNLTQVLREDWKEVLYSGVLNKI